MKISDYHGKVVLMPFWATGFPPSLQVVPQLKAIRDAHTDEVAIVGINLDADRNVLEAFIASNDLGFPSFFAQSTINVANPVAVQFGMVGMPFVAVLDQKGNVAAVEFGTARLQDTVSRLLQ